MSVLKIKKGFHEKISKQVIKKRKEIYLNVIKPIIGFSLAWASLKLARCIFITYTILNHILYITLINFIQFFCKLV